MKKCIMLSVMLPLFFKLCMPDGRAGLWPLILIDMFLLPGCLVCLNAIIILKAKRSALFAASISLFGLIVGNLAGYIRWGVASGKLLDPDGETIWIVEKIFIYQICFVAVGLAIILIIKAVKNICHRSN